MPDGRREKYRTYNRNRLTVTIIIIYNIVLCVWEVILLYILYKAIIGMFYIKMI